MQIGDVLYTYDMSRRKYDEDGRPDARSNWKAHAIIGETRVSWIIEDGYKVEKDTLLLRGIKDFRGLRNRAFAEPEMRDKLWVELNHFRIVDAVERTEDIMKLHQVAVLLGVECEE